jgi:hypothetical protein
MYDASFDPSAPFPWIPGKVTVTEPWMAFLQVLVHTCACDRDTCTSGNRSAWESEMLPGSLLASGVDVMRTFIRVGATTSSSGCASVRRDLCDRRTAQASASSAPTPMALFWCVDGARCARHEECDAYAVHAGSAHARITRTQMSLAPFPVSPSLPPSPSLSPSPSLPPAFLSLRPPSRHSTPSLPSLPPSLPSLPPLPPLPPSGGVCGHQRKRRHQGRPNRLYRACGVNSHPRSWVLLVQLQPGGRQLGDHTRGGVQGHATRWRNW